MKNTNMVDSVDILSGGFEVKIVIKLKSFIENNLNMVKRIK